MPPALRRKLEHAVLLGCLLACTGCDTDFSPEGKEQREEPIEAGEPSAPPLSDDAGQPDGEMPELPVTDAEIPKILKFTCQAIWRCDRADPNCQPLCLASSMEIDRCTPTEPCKAFGFSPVPCTLCMDPPIK